MKNVCSYAILLCLLVAPADPPEVPALLTYDLVQGGPDAAKDSYRVTVHLSPSKRFIAYKHTAGDGECAADSCQESWLRGDWVRYKGGRIALVPDGDALGDMVLNATGMAPTLFHRDTAWISFGSLPNKSRFRFRLDGWACEDLDSIGDPLRVRMWVRGKGVLLEEEG